jgi:hypothetical protein
MIASTAKTFIGQQVDRMALYAMNLRIPNNGARRFECPVTLEDVLAGTRVQEYRTPPYQVTAPGEHKLHLDSRLGEIACKVMVRPAADASAPLLLYHHGLAEFPYTSSWRRLLPKDAPIAAHTVAVQAPYHNNLADPVRIGFSSTEHLYQMLAGSMRIMQYVQDQFARQGSAYTVASGVSWGGITSLLYGGLLGKTRATVPLFASPRLSQAIWDATQMFGRDLPVTREELDAVLDFTPIYERIDQRQVFPVLGEYDLFFRLENHAPVYDENSLVTLPLTHVGAMWQGNGTVREHVLGALAWAADQPN